MIDKHSAVAYTFFWIGMKIDSASNTEYWEKVKQRYGKDR